MKRFFTTFVLLVGVASSLVVSDSLFKVKTGSNYANSKNSEIEKSIDFTELNVKNSQEMNLYVTTPYYFN